MMIVLPTVKCNLCKWTWTPRQATLPKRCPRCRSYEWNEVPKVKR